MKDASDDIMMDLRNKQNQKLCTMKFTMQANLIFCGIFQLLHIFLNFSVLIYTKLFGCHDGGEKTNMTTVYVQCRIKSISIFNTRTGLEFTIYISFCLETCCKQFIK